MSAADRGIADHDTSRHGHAEANRASRQAVHLVGGPLDDIGDRRTAWRSAARTDSGAGHQKRRDVRHRQQHVDVLVADEVGQTLDERPDAETGSG